MDELPTLTPAQYAALQALRGSVLLRTRKGQIIAQKWPKKRGPARSQAQQAWQDQFSLLATLSKTPHPAQFDRATELAKDTGWYYRDVLETAMVGKLYIEENERRVTTPTAIGHRVAVTSVPSSGFTHLPMDVPEADNNAFWSAANPTRFTAKTAGLYICGYSVEWNPNAGNARGSVIVGKNGAPDRHAADFPANTLANFWQSGMTMYYLHANDYVEVLVYKSAAGASCRISTFWIVGITPEVII